MPKRKTFYVVWADNPTQVSGLPDHFGIVAWDVEAWNAAHAARIVRNNGDFGLLKDEKLGVCPAIYFSEHQP